MSSLNNIITFFFFITLNFIKTEDIKIWENEPEIIPNVINEDIDNIYSYAVDDETGAELYLVIKDDNSKFILKDGSSYKTLLNTFNKLIEIKSPLIKYNTKYYFCSSESLIMTDGYQIYELRKFNDIKDLKCLRANKYILVSLIGTPYISIFDLSNNLWINNLSLEIKIHAINNYKINDIRNHYITVGEKENDDNNYYFYIFIFEGELLIIEKEQYIEKEKIELYLENNSTIELVSKEVSNGRNLVTFLFAYVPNTSLYSIYNVNVERKEEFFEIKFFRFFNHFIIKSAGFIQDIPFLYFSVESMINGQKYIGLAHIEYYLLIFNIVESINNKLYYNYGNYFKDNGKLFYFSGNKQISFCPFIKIGDKCINNFNNDTFSISLNETSNLYNNIKTTTCDNKKVLDYYCLENCPNGFIDISNGGCDYCNIEEK